MSLCQPESSARIESQNPTRLKDVGIVAQAADARARSVVVPIGKVGLSRASVDPAEERDIWLTRRFNDAKQQ